MAVRVNKSAFNIREKINELTKRFGLKGSELMRAETAQEAGALLGVGRRNLCINGNFKVWQRGTSIAGGASGNTTNSYKYVTADRWQTYFYNTYARQDSILPTGERVYSFRETFNATRLYFDTVIEDGGRIFNQGDHITVSFWAKTSGPPTGVSIGFYWHSGANFAGGSYTYSNIRKNIIIEGSDWKYYTATALLPANADNRPHLAVEFENDQSHGDWTQLSGTDYWEFANIQIEKGKVATEFEHRSYGEELALCQRYFWSLTNNYNNSWNPLTWGHGGSANRVFTNIVCPVAMRDAPSIYNKQVNVQDGGTTSDVTDRLYPDGGTAYITEYGGFDEQTHLALQITATSTTDGNGYRVNVKNVSGTAGYIYFDAEL